MQALYHRVYLGPFDHMCRDTMFKKTNGAYVLRKSSTDPDEPTKDLRCNDLGLEAWLEDRPDQITLHGLRTVGTRSRRREVRK